MERIGQFHVSGWSTATERAPIDEEQIKSLVHCQSLNRNTFFGFYRPQSVFKTDLFHRATKIIRLRKPTFLA